MHAQRCEFSLGKVLLNIVANLQKDRFHKNFFFFLKKVFSLKKGFENFWKIMAISSKGFLIKNAQ